MMLFVRRFRGWSLIVVVASGLLWAGCGGSERTRTSSGAEGGQGRPGLPLAALVEAGLHPTPQQDSLAVLDRLRPPLRMRNEPFENRHVPGQIDTLRTFYYRGLRFTVYDVAHDPKEMMQSITVTGSAYATANDLRVGMRRNEVRSVLGVPDRVEEGVFVYEIGDPTPNQLRVVIEDDRVSRLEWNFYID